MSGLDDMKRLTAKAARGEKMPKVYTITATNRQWNTLEGTGNIDEWYEVLGDITQHHPKWLESVLKNSYQPSLTGLTRRGELDSVITSGKKAAPKQKSDLLIFVHVTRQADSGVFTEREVEL